MYSRVAEYMENSANCDEIAFEWERIDSMARRFKQHLRPLLRTIDLSATRVNAPIQEAIHFLKTAFQKDRSLHQIASEDFPTDFFPVREKRYLYQRNETGQKHLIPDRYEFLVYRLVRHRLEAGDLFCRDSVHFRSWEYDNIISSLYLLDFVDSPLLRKNVQTALNRGESYHQLRRAVSYANFGKLRFTSEDDQHLWHECSRLVTNCIIFYNMTILSLLWERQEATQDMAHIAHISPVAWQHINFYGRYEFTKASEPINMEEIVEALAHHPTISVWMKEIPG
jgi:hypothetical protein